MVAVYSLITSAAAAPVHAEEPAATHNTSPGVRPDIGLGWKIALGSALSLVAVSGLLAAYATPTINQAIAPLDPNGRARVGPETIVGTSAGLGLAAALTIAIAADVSMHNI